MPSLTQMLRKALLQKMLGLYSIEGRRKYLELLLKVCGGNNEKDYINIDMPDDNDYSICIDI